VEKAIDKISNSNYKTQNGKPVLFEERQPLIPVWQAFVFHKLAEENIAPDGAQSKGDWIKYQPEDDIFSGYGCPALPC